MSQLRLVVGPPAQLEVPCDRSALRLNSAPTGRPTPAAPPQTLPDSSSGLWRHSDVVVVKTITFNTLKATTADTAILQQGRLDLKPNYSI